MALSLQQIPAAECQKPGAGDPASVRRRPAGVPFGCLCVGFAVLGGLALDPGGGRWARPARACMARAMRPVRMVDAAARRTARRPDSAACVDGDGHVARVPIP